MFPAFPPEARWTAGLIALIAAASLVGFYLFNMEIDRYGGPTETLWGMARFFTVLTNALVVFTFGAAALRRDGVDGPWLAALVLSIVLTGAVFHVLLAGITTFTGIGVWANQGLHSVVPVACLIWWFAFAPKRRLDYRDLPIFIMWPCLYVAYALGRGARDGIYPYPFMDLSERAAIVVLTNLSGLVIVLLLGGVILVMIGKFVDR